MKLNIKSLIIVIAIVIALIHLISCVSTPKPHKNTECHVPVIVGHRGAPGHAPEHTLHSYKLALDMGADYIEPDLVSTKDGVLISRHENEISGTTNVAEVFPKRKKAKVVDGDKISGWFTEDFTLKEIKRLRARERLPFRSHCEDDQYEIATFEEILQFVEREEKARGRRIGLAPEIKHSTYFSGVGLPLEGRVVDLLRRHHRVSRDSLVMIQSSKIAKNDRCGARAVT